MNTKLYLVATSGDLAEGGLSIKAVAIPVDNKHKKIIKEFLMAQQEKYIEFCYWKPQTEYNQEYLNNYYKCFDRLFDVGIFDNKWEARTDWKLVYECDLDLLEYQIKEIEKGDWFEDHVIIMGLSDKNTNQLKNKLKNELIKGIK